MTPALPSKKDVQMWAKWMTGHSAERQVVEMRKTAESREPKEDKIPTAPISCPLPETSLKGVAMACV